MEINQITGTIIDSAMKVHSVFGPGLLESAYKACLVYELRKRGLRVDVEVALPLIYDGVNKKVGLLINFKVVHLRDGIKRMVNNL